MTSPIDRNDPTSSPSSNQPTRPFHHVLAKKPLKAHAGLGRALALKSEVLANLAPMSLSGTDPVRDRCLARTKMDLDGERLRRDRSEDLGQADRLDDRARGLIAQALEQPPTPAPMRLGPDGKSPDEARALGSVAGGRPRASGATERTEAILNLVDRIDVFVKSQRPALGLTLSGALEGRLEIERVGPKTVAVKVSGRAGLGPDALTELRSALASRGLTLAAFERS